MSAATWSWRTTPSTKGQWATGRICCIATAMRHPCCQCSERVYHRGYHRHHLGLNPAGVKNPFTWPLPLEPGLQHSNGCSILKIDDQLRDIEYCWLKAIGPVKLSLRYLAISSTFRTLSRSWTATCVLRFCIRSL